MPKQTPNQSKIKQKRIQPKLDQPQRISKPKQNKPQSNPNNTKTKPRPQTKAKPTPLQLGQASGSSMLGKLVEQTKVLEESAFWAAEKGFWFWNGCF